jgi:hypothetical protein
VFVKSLLVAMFASLLRDSGSQTVAQLLSRVPPCEHLTFVYLTAGCQSISQV